MNLLLSLYSTAGYRELGLTDKATSAQSGRSSELPRSNTFSAPFDTHSFDGSREFSRRQDSASGYWNQSIDKRESTQPYDSAAVRQADNLRTSWKDNELSSAGYQRPEVGVEDTSWNSGVKQPSPDNTYNRAQSRDNTYVTQSRDSDGNSSFNTYKTYNQEQSIPGLDMLSHETATQPGLLSRESLQTAFQSGGMRQSRHEQDRQSAQMMSKDTSRGMSSEEQRVDMPDRRLLSSTYGQPGMEGARRLPSDNYKQQNNWPGQSSQPGNCEQREMAFEPMESALGKKFSSDNYQQSRNMPGNYKQPEMVSKSLENPPGRVLSYRDYDERCTDTPEQALRSSNYGETEIVSKAVESQQGRKWPYDHYEKQCITSQPPGSQYERSQQSGHFGDLGNRSKPSEPGMVSPSDNRGQSRVQSPDRSGSWPGRGMPTDNWQRQGVALRPIEGNRPGMTQDEWSGDRQGKWTNTRPIGQQQYVPPTEPWARPRDTSTGKMGQPPHIVPLLQLHPTGSLHQKSVQQKSVASSVDRTQQSPNTQQQENNRMSNTSSALLQTPQGIFKQPRPAPPQVAQQNLARSGFAMPLTPQEILPQKCGSAMSQATQRILEKSGSVVTQCPQGIFQKTESGMSQASQGILQKSVSGMTHYPQGIFQKLASGMSQASQGVLQKSESGMSQTQSSLSRFLPRGTVYCSVSGAFF